MLRGLGNNRIRGEFLLGGAALAAGFGVSMGLAAACARGEAARLAERMAALDRQCGAQRKRLLALQGEMDRWRRQRHDLRHHLTLLHGLMETDPHRASAYLSQLVTPSAPAQGHICANIAADCLLRQYSAAAKLEGAQVEMAVYLPEEIGMDDLDLCVILGNLLENALEALRREPVEKRRLLVSAGLSGKILAVNVENTCSAAGRGAQGPLRSWKRRDKPGIGLASVRAAAQQYNGQFWWRRENGVFRASIVCVTESG